MNSIRSKAAPRAAKPFLHWPRPTIILAFGLVLGFSAGQGWPWLGPLGCAPAQETAAFRVIPEAWQIVQRRYVDRPAIKPRALAHGAVAGMIAALGDVGHSTFVSPGMVKQLEQTERGQLQGVGVEVAMKDGKPTVIAPIDDSPAMRAGIRPGDIIVQVDHSTVEDLPLPEIAARVSGRPGTTVALTLLDPGSGKQREVSLVRADVRLQSVSWARLPGSTVALVRIARFDEHTDIDLHDALVKIRQEPTAGIILDLRNNPGGILDTAVKVASEFLAGGNVLYAKNSEGVLRPIPVHPGGTAQDLPLIALVNGASASAAEIVAGALQDAHRAPLVGETTFGTGTVLQEFRLSDGSALLLAVQEWLTPGKRSFWHKGIAPDVTLSNTNGMELLLPKALATLTRAQVETNSDTQLLRGWRILEH